jgi:hypothetical protein
VKQNLIRKGKQEETKEPIGKRKRKSSHSSPDSDGDSEEPILVDSDEDSSDDVVSILQGTVLHRQVYQLSPMPSRRMFGADVYKKFVSAFHLVLKQCVNINTVKY